jgi:hypothetical protein
MNFKSMQDESKSLRVWWRSSSIMTHYYIDKLEDAQIVIDILSLREVDDESIDFNVHGVEMKENNEWVTWYDDEGLDYEEYIESLEEGN